jgi:hypothetical protein
MFPEDLRKYHSAQDLMGYLRNAAA